MLETGLQLHGVGDPLACGHLREHGYECVAQGHGGRSGSGASGVDVAGSRGSVGRDVERRGQSEVDGGDRGKGTAGAVGEVKHYDAALHRVSLMTVDRHCGIDAGINHHIGRPEGSGKHTGMEGRADNHAAKFAFAIPAPITVTSHGTMPATPPSSMPLP